MSQFLIQMTANVLLELNRRHDAWSLKIPDVDPIPYLRNTPPFANAPIGHILDVRKPHKPVPCPQVDCLIELLAAIAAKHGKRYVKAMQFRFLDERYERKKALKLWCQFLEAQDARRRHKKTWELFRKAATRLVRLSEQAYKDRDLDQDWFRWLQAWYHDLTVDLFDAFRKYGPPRRAYPNVAVYHAIATILNSLCLETYDLEPLAQRIRVRCYKAHLLP
jgi:hypothetical protein